jgi:hypothetical protein
MLALGLATNCDVPEVKLRVSNVAAQLMAGSLLRRSILCFERRIRGDVLRRVLGPDEFFRKQIKTERGKVERR